MTAVNPPQSQAARGADRVALALLRIEASREALRHTLIPPPAPARAAGGAPHNWITALRLWLKGTPLAPLAKPAWAAVRHWWRQQPWHASGEAAARLVGDEVVPLLRRRPLVAVGAAAVAGAALVAARPWRWLWPHARGSGSSRGGALPWLWLQLSQPPVQMALAAALAAWGSHKAASSTCAASDADDAPAPTPGPTSTPRVDPGVPPALT